MLVFILLIQRTAIPDGNLVFFWEMPYKITDGVMKGIYVTGEHYDDYYLAYNVLSENSDKDDTIAILSPGFFQLGYALTEAQCGISDLDPVSLDKSNYLEYWQKNQSKIPNKIFIFSNDDIRLFEESASTLSLYIKDNYSVSLKTKDICIMQLESP